MIDATGGDIGVSLDSGGLSLADNRRQKRLFKITSGSNPYAASEIVLDESDGSRDAIGAYALTTAQKLLWETNGNTAVAADTIVEATPNPAGSGFYFTYPTSGPPDAEWSYGSGTGSIPTIGLTTIATITLGAGDWLVWYALSAGYTSDTLGDEMFATMSGGTATIVHEMAAIVCRTVIANQRNSGTAAGVMKATGPGTVLLRAGYIRSLSTITGGTWSLNGNGLGAIRCAF